MTWAALGAEIHREFHAWTMHEVTIEYLFQRERRRSAANWDRVKLDGRALRKKKEGTNRWKRTNRARFSQYQREYRARKKAGL